MSRPRILIPIPTSFDEEYNAKSWPEYAQAIIDAGGEPVQIAFTHTAAELEVQVKTAAGVLLPGSGADVDPVRYGQERNPASAEPDAPREETDRTLLEAAEHLSKPLFGICLGLQSLNVYHGGTLIQDVCPVPVNHRAGRAVLAAHVALCSLESRLGATLKDSPEVVVQDREFARVPVNSSHHQAVATPGDRLRIVARCPEDGVIEAVEGSDPARWLLGVQWHPERTIHVSSTSRAMFASFVDACSRQWQP